MKIINSFTTYNILTEKANNPINACLIEMANEIYESNSKKLIDADILESFYALFEEYIIISESENNIDPHLSTEIAKAGASFWLTSLAVKELQAKLGTSFKEVIKNSSAGIAKGASKAKGAVVKGASKAKGAAVKNPKAAAALAAAAIVVAVGIKALQSRAKKRLELEAKVEKEEDKKRKERLIAQLEKMKQEEKEFKKETKEKVEKAKKQAREKVEKDPGAAANIIKKGKKAADSLPS